MNFAGDLLDHYHEIKSRGYTIQKVGMRAIEIFGVEQDIYAAARVAEGPLSKNRRPVVFFKQMNFVHIHHQIDFLV